MQQQMCQETKSILGHCSYIQDGEKPSYIAFRCSISDNYQ